ncbi:ABC transporter ATP-binding protein [Luteococcus sp. H138]|uniref:ABC transporter ATP-binding protein n=1 Tax=unclassified Luteococcus TaxID=2639923 RepID=UPI00313EAD01
MATLQTQDLHHRFDHGPEVLKGIDVTFEPASTTAIMGPSGSGKSTLLNCISGLLRPTSGQIHYDGHDLARVSAGALDRLRRRSWGFIFQSYNLVDALTAIDNVKLPALFDGQRMSDQAATEALSSVGLGDFTQRYPDQLSGGQRQRVAIARALATHRDVVFADEPTGALDSESRRDVMTHLNALPQHGSTVILVTHDPTVAASASRVLFLFDGRIADDAMRLDASAIAQRITALEALACAS